MRTRLPILIALMAASTLRADILTYTATPNGGGLTSYQFTLENTGTTGGTVFDLFLAIPLDISFIDTPAIGTPIGWGDTTGGLLFFGSDVNPSSSFIQWAADFSGLYDVGIGSALSGFSFVASQPVTGPIMFALNGSTDFGTALSGVPEPGTSFMLLIPLAATFAFRVLRKAPKST